VIQKMAVPSPTDDQILSGLPRPTSATVDDQLACPRYRVQTHHHPGFDRRDPTGSRGIALAADGKTSSNFSWDKLENIDVIFACMEEGRIDGRVVLDLQ
jgi:hypothetical protein